MIKFLERISEENILLDIVDGRLKLFSDNEEIAPEILEEIKERKEEILSYLQNQINFHSQRSSHENIPKIKQFDNYELSDAQKRLWVLSQIKDNSVAYNMPSQIRLNDDYDITYFKKAIGAVIDRHEILRTIFKEDDRGEVRQWVLLPEELSFEVDYLDYRDKSNKEDLVREYINKDSYKPFDLENGPLLRASLLQLSEDSYVFYYNMHHIISDGWSREVLIKDVLSYYDAYASGDSTTLPALPIQYKDYASWQLSQISTESYMKSQEYWLDHLSGDLPVLDLPSNVSRPKIKTTSGFRLSTYIDSSTTSSLREFSHSSGGSLFMGLLSSWNALFYRYACGDDFIIGTPVAGRDHEDLEGQIGFYVNTLALRNKVDSSDNFESLFSRVKDGTLSAYMHQGYPFDRLVDDLSMSRDTSRSALFDVMLVLQNTGDTNSEVAVDASECGIIREEGLVVSKFDLELTFQEIGGCLRFQVTYNSDVYDQAMISRLMEHYQRFLSRLISDPTVSIGDIDYLSQSERKELLFDFNDTSVAYPQDATLVSLFASQVASIPDHTAVVFEGKSLTYRELDKLSNRLANYLLSNYEIDVEDLVIIKLERNEWFIITILAVLKAGAAYVPVDLKYPQERIDFIESNTKSKVIIDQNLIEDSNRATIYCDHPIKVNISSSNLAYIMYTSGSTGKPKGVMVEHGNVIRLVKSSNYINITSEDVILGLSNFSFDGSTFDIFMPLLNGAKLMISEKNIFLDLQKFNLLIQTKNISCFFITTALFNTIVEAELPSLKQLKCILFGGEQVSVKQVKRFKDVYPLVNLHHVYGPTENTTFSTFYKIDKINDNHKTIPVGHPISNSKVYVLDKNHSLTPIGVVGEVYLGGDGVARGYLNRQELTEEKFIQNPFLEGDRIYKTGDLGRWLTDGTIEFIGRIDHQVKIRGYRIELGEIEFYLQSKDSIIDAIVLAIPDSVGSEKVLVAYFVSEEQEDISELRSYLSKSLPSYMLPSYYKQLDNIPLTANGKVATKMLPRPSDFGALGGCDYVAPRNDLEKALVDIWVSILDRDRIGINDDFFVLGGHSLKASRLISSYHQTFGVKLELKDIFLHTTLVSHADLLDDTSSTGYVSIPRLAPSSSYAVSDAQRRLWVLSQFPEGSISYNMPFSVILDGDYDISCFRQAVSSVIARHESLRTVFREDDTGEVRQFILSPESLNFDIDYFDFRDTLEKDIAVSDYISSDSRVAFDLENGPLLRASLLQVSDDSYVFYYNMHHIISDGWSIDVLVKDVLSYYEAYVSGNSATLPALSIQYKDYASWQLSQISTESYIKSQKYWLDHLSGDLPVLNLPSNVSRPKIKTTSGFRLSTYIDSSTTSSLREFSHSSGGSLFMGLLSSWNALFYRYACGDDFIIGTPIAGRNHKDLEGQIGFYVNTLALRNKVDSSDNFESLFSRVKDSTLSAYMHQEYPFDRLVDDLSLRRYMSRSALFDVMLVLQNAGDTHSEIVVDAYEFGIIREEGLVVSKFDLELTFQEIGGYLKFQVTYNSDVYDQAMISRLMGHYQRFLSRLVSDPTVSIGDIDYLCKAERKELLFDFNDTSVAYSQDATFVSLFASQVASTPDNIAIVFKDKSLTYRELDKLSNRLANYLLSNYDIKENQLIGINQERSEWMLISILAILKSGGAYIPIDPLYPKSKIKYIEKDSNCNICVDFRELEKFWADLSQYSKGKVSNNISSSSLAYVIYTSGSTGNPKGVPITHTSLVDYITTFKTYFSISSKDTMIQQASIAFDTSIEEIFPILLSGGTLVISTSHKDLGLLLRECEKYSVTLLSTNPYAIEYLNQYRDEYSLRLRTLISGGDVLKPSFITNIYQEYDIYNTYGPTESTVCTTYHRIRDNDLNKNIPIGKPITNRKVYVLDLDQKPVPIGVIGELYIGGHGLSNGYLNLSEETSSRFIENPFSEGERLYRSGDLVKWLDDGSIEFVGRADGQVKIRGYRIELGEIEYQLRQSEAVKEAVVIVKTTEISDKELVAYIVSDKKINIKALRNSLSNSLPEYMLPSYFVPLEKLPLTLNGKIDKRALPDPHENSVYCGEEYIAPRNDLEKALVDIWVSILDRDRIGINDDFFVLGGHSLKASRLISSYHQTFGVKLELKDIFLHTTLVSHAYLLDDTSSTGYVSIPRLARSSSYAVSDAQRRLWVLSQFPEGSISYNMPFSVTLDGDYDISCFRQAVSSVIARHESLRTVFREDDTGEVRQFILSPESLNFDIDYFDFRDTLEKDIAVSDYISSDSRVAFDLENGPLLRASLLQVSDDSYVFYYNMHHIISDGLSIDVLVKDVLSYYEAYVVGDSATLPVLPIQYKDYVGWLNKELTGTKLEKYQKYWRGVFKEGIPDIVFPFEKNRPESYTYRGNLIKLNLGKEIRNGLERISKDNNGTLYITLVFIMKFLIHKYTGNQKIMVGSSFSTRVHPDLENQIGFYVNNLPLISDIQETSNIGEAYSSVRNTVLDVLNHKLYPLEYIMDHVDYKHHKSKPGLFNILVEYHHNRGDNIDDDLSERENNTRYIQDVANQLDISFEFFDKKNDMILQINYNKDIFDHRHIELLKNRFIKLSSWLIKAHDNVSDFTIKDYDFENEMSEINFFDLVPEEQF